MRAADDFRGLWAMRLVRRRDRMRVAVDSILARLYAAWWGVELGLDCRFHGRPLFRREPGSRIIIGDHCQFRSALVSNLGGLNRPCMLSTLYEGARIAIGAQCGFSGTVIAAARRIEIGERVLCGANTTITDTDWHTADPLRRSDPGPAAPVVIEENVWLGLGVIVLKGVTIGRDSVIGAGSVVTRSIPPGVIAAGQPARVIRQA